MTTVNEQVGTNDKSRTNVVINMYLDKVNDNKDNIKDLRSVKDTKRILEKMRGLRRELTTDLSMTSRTRSTLIKESSKEVRV